MSGLGRFRAIKAVKTRLQASPEMSCRDPNTRFSNPPAPSTSQAATYVAHEDDARPDAVCSHVRFSVARSVCSQ